MRLGPQLRSMIYLKQKIVCTVLKNLTLNRMLLTANLQEIGLSVGQILLRPGLVWGQIQVLSIPT